MEDKKEKRFVLSSDQISVDLLCDLMGKIKKECPRAKDFKFVFDKILESRSPKKRKQLVTVLYKLPTKIAIVVNEKLLTNEQIINKLRTIQENKTADLFIVFYSAVSNITYPSRYMHHGILFKERITKFGTEQNSRTLVLNYIKTNFEYKTIYYVQDVPSAYNYGESVRVLPLSSFAQKELVEA